MTQINKFVLFLILNTHLDRSLYTDFLPTTHVRKTTGSLYLQIKIDFTTTVARCIVSATFYTAKTET